MSSAYRNLAGGVSDSPLSFLDDPDYDEAFGPPDTERFLDKVMRDIEAFKKKEPMLPA